MSWASRGPLRNLIGRLLRRLGGLLGCLGGILGVWEGYLGVAGPSWTVRFSPGAFWGPSGTGQRRASGA
eukprot:305975-Pyramimonas_sp.AAC.1